MQAQEAASTVSVGETGTSTVSSRRTWEGLTIPCVHRATRKWLVQSPRISTYQAQTSRLWSGFSENPNVCKRLEIALVSSKRECSSLLSLLFLSLWDKGRHGKMECLEKGPGCLCDRVVD